MTDVAALRALLDKTSEFAPLPWKLDGLWAYDADQDPETDAAHGDGAAAPLFVAAVNALPDLLAAAEAVERVKALHQPRTDSPGSLVSSPYCSCGAMGTFTASDGYPSIGPAHYPCPTVRALGGEQSE